MITHSYGLHPSDINCFIFKYGQNDIAFVERLALWDAPAMLILIMASTAMVVMVIYLVHTMCRRSTYEPITDGDKFWKALKQLLPLASFPILFFVFEIPNFIYHVYLPGNAPTASMVAALIFMSQWSMASGITLLVHISVALRHMHIKKNIASYHNSSNRRTVGQDTGVTVKSDTSFPLPSDNINGDGKLSSNSSY